MPANTSAASAICGTHFGLTNADTSMTGRSAALSRLTNAILSAVGTERALVLQPVARPDFDDRDVLSRSRVARRHGPSVTRSRPPASASAWTSSPSRQCTAATDAVAERAHRQLHLHRLEHDDVSPFFTRVAWLDEHLDHRRRHRRRSSAPRRSPLRRSATRRRRRSRAGAREPRR